MAWNCTSLKGRRFQEVYIYYRCYRRWVDCVQINGIIYESNYERTQIDVSLVGKQIGTVRFNVSDNVHNPNYHFRNGDATYLTVGTKMYEVNVTDSNDSVGVKVDNRYFLYKYHK